MALDFDYSVYRHCLGLLHKIRMKPQCAPHELPDLDPEHAEFQWRAGCIAAAYGEGDYGLVPRFLEAMPVSDGTLAALLPVILRAVDGKDIEALPVHMHLLEHVILPLGRRLKPADLLEPFARTWRRYAVLEPVEAPLLVWMLYQLSDHFRAGDVSRHEQSQWLERLRTWGMPPEQWRKAVIGAWFRTVPSTRSFLEGRPHSHLLGSADATSMLFMDQLAPGPITWEERKPLFLELEPDGSLADGERMHRQLAAKHPKHFA